MKLSTALNRLILIAAAGLVATLIQAQNPAAARFDKVTADLDKQGDFFLYVSAAETSKLVAERYPLLAQLIEADAARKGQGKTEETRKLLAALEGTVKDSGLGDLAAIGASSVALNERLYRSRVVLYHEPGKGQGRLWQMFGTQSHKLDILNLLPADTTFVSFGDFDLALAWQWLGELIRQLGDEPAQAQFQGGLALAKLQGFDLEEMIKSTGGQFGYILTLNENRMITVPIGGRDMDFPEPALLNVMKVKDNKIVDTLKTFWRNKKVAFATERLDDDTVIYTFPIPIGQGLPFALTPTVATYKEWLLIGTSAAIVNQAIAVDKQKEKGLTATREYLRLAKDLPATGNQLFYCSPKLSEYVAALLERGIRKDHTEENTKAIMALLGLNGAPFYGCLVAERRDTGFVVTANSTVVMSEAAIAAGISTPILLVAAARGRAQQQGQNEQALALRKQNTAKLQQIGLGLMLYAGDNQGKYPAPDGAAGLNALVAKDYLSGGTAYIHPADKTRPANPDKIKKLTEEILSYVYVGGGLKDNDEWSAITPVCFDKPGLGNGVTVLFIDGHVEFFEGNFPTRVAVIELLKQRKQLPDARYRELLSKAKALDAAP